MPSYSILTRSRARLSARPSWSVCLALGLLLTALPAAGDEDRWLRYPAISPDGETIAFSWRGDLWTVPSAGGEAERLTSHAAYEAWPVWAPDSRSLAFASDRFGQLDVFLVDAEGGAATRLTFHSSDDYPSTFTADGSRLYFSANRQHAPQALLGSGRRFEELYSISTAGGAPRQELTTTAEDARLSPDGRYMLYEEVRAYENEWRKHHTTSASRDLWSWNLDTGEHHRLTSFEGEDRKPVWLPSSRFGDAMAYLSEQDGNLDVYRLDLEDGKPAGEPRQLTDHGPHPVRFLSSADDGTLAYLYDGAIYTLAAEGGEPRRVAIELTSDERENGLLRETHRDGATEMAVSPHGDEVAFVIRGEIFVASAEYGTTRRLTETPEQERSLSWAPDGRTLYFAGERDGAWNLYSLSLVDEAETRFFEATALEESEVLVGEDETFQPVVSPDGTRLAFLHNRDEIRLLDLESGEQRIVVPKERNYSYSDGDIEYVFSPDGRWLAATYIPFERWITEIALVELESGEVHNATLSGYGEGTPHFTPDGQALLFLSSRHGLRSHSGRESESDVFALSLNRRAWDLAQLSVEEFERRQEAEKRARGGKKGEKDDDEDGEKGEAGEAPRKPISPMTVETEDFEYRTKRLTVFSAEISDFASSEDGEVLFFIGRTEDDFDLWMARPRHGEVKRLAELDDEDPGELEMSADGESLFIRSGRGRLMRLEVDGLLRSLKRNGNGGGDGERGGMGRARPKPVPFGAEMTVDRAAERRHLFEHVWRQVKRKFYRADLHGADWPALKATYGRFLDDLRHSRDFAELLSEMLGELNASHTGGRYRPRGLESDETASLGLLFDLSREEQGLEIADVLKRGPADRAESRLEAGVVITHIDGTELATSVNTWALLDRKAGERVRLGLQTPSGETFEEVIRAIPEREERRLRYLRWMERLREMADELSGGRVGYVHVEGMNDRSYRSFYQETLGRQSDKEALIVDTRYNGGGWLHDDLAAFLQGEKYLTVVPRDKEPGSFGAESFERWTRPVAVLQNEANYSDAFIFPWTFKELELGTLVGMPVAATGTAVWWERLIDPDIVFGIPQVGMIDSEGSYMENFDLVPDVLVKNDAESVARGEDKQLAAAVTALLEQLDAE